MIFKKIFIISSVLLVTVLFFLGIYNFAFKSKTPSLIDTVTKNTENVPSQTPAQKNKDQKLYAITDDSVLSPTLSSSKERILYYTYFSGNVYEIGLDGTDRRTISSASLSGLQSIQWSPDKSEVISQFSKDGLNSFYFYDYDIKSGTKLKGGIDLVHWSNLGDKIIYKYFDKKAKKRSLNIANPDGTNWQKLADLPFQLVDFNQIPQTSLVAFWNAPNAFEETKLQTVGITGGEAKTIFSGRFGADYLWATDGSKALASSVSSKGGSKMMLATINSNGGEYQNLDIPTLVSKCVWSNDNKTVYYALPGAVTEGTVMPNDYQSKKVSTKDTFWKVDVATGKKERIIELNGIMASYDATNLFLSGTGDALFFVNRLDGKIYRIDL